MIDLRVSSTPLVRVWTTIRRRPWVLQSDLGARVLLDVHHAEPALPRDAEAG